MFRSLLGSLVTVVCLFTSSGCSRIYYASMEKLGKEKRDILVKRIVEGKKDQEEAREQIKTTLEAFKELTGFEGGDLERVYQQLNGEYESARKRANDVSNRIKSIDHVAGDMFKEWDKEIGEMRDPALKNQSRAMLKDAQIRHQQYMSAMHATERKMEPVIQAFYDQVTLLKHNLNARAIRSLKTTVTKLDRQVDSLVQDIEVSMKHSDTFVQSLLTANANS